MTDSLERRRDVGEFIRTLRRQSRLSVRRLSELAGVSNPYLSQVERGLRQPSARILQRIAKALAISAETLYLQAGILEEYSPEEAATEFEARLERDPLLNEDQRRALSEQYRSFVAPAGLARVHEEPSPATSGATGRTPAGSSSDDAEEASPA